MSAFCTRGPTPVPFPLLYTFIHYIQLQEKERGGEKERDRKKEELLSGYFSTSLRRDTHTSYMYIIKVPICYKYI